MNSGAGGTMLKVTPLGRKQFVRPIKKHKAGVYLDFIFDLKEAVAAGLPDKYRLDERILRMQVLVYDRPEEPAQAPVGVVRKIEVPEPIIPSIN
jgi:ribosomal protein S6